MRAKETIAIKGNIDIEKLACRLVELMQEKQACTDIQYISELEVMAITGIKSKGAILKLRQEGKIRYTQPYKRVIMYDKQSVLEFLGRHIKNPFGQ